ncbi:MAG: hypothetical protein R3C99_25840 [Pirellulaceae bacterium]
MGTTAVEGYVLRGLGGDDTFNVTALANIGVTVQGDESANHTNVLNYTSVGGTTVELGNNEIEDAGVAGTPDVVYAGIDVINVVAGGQNLTVQGSTGNDDLLVRPTGANSATVIAEGQPIVNGSGIGTFTVDGNGGNDQVTVEGSAGADAFTTISDTLVAITGAESVVLANLGANDALTINGFSGNDTFAVTPSANVPIFVSGGNPTASVPGDALNINAGRQRDRLPAGPTPDSGSFEIGRECSGQLPGDRVGRVHR